MCVCRKTVYIKGFIIRWVAWPCLKIFLESKSSNFCWSKAAKFWLGHESFLRRKAFHDEIFRDKIMVFLKSFVTPSKIRTVINFYPKTLTRFPKKYFRGWRGFGFYWSNYILSNFENNWNVNVKIILTGEHSFQQMYRNKMSFLTYWFLRIKCLFIKP